MKEFIVREYPAEIAERLLKLTERSQDKKQDLENALYTLKCYAENEHNAEGYRVLYDCLAALATGFFEIRAGYSETGPDGQRQREYLQGATPGEAMNAYYTFMDNLDAAKYENLHIETASFVVVDHEEK